MTSDTPRMSSPPQASFKNSEFNARKINFNPNVSHFIWFSPISQNTNLTEKSEKSLTDIKVYNDLEDDIEENFNLEKYEKLNIRRTSKYIQDILDITTTVTGLPQIERNKSLIKIKPTKIQKFKSKLVRFMKGSRFAGIPLAMSK